MDEERTHHPEIDHPYLAETKSYVPMLKVIEGTLCGMQFEIREKVLIGRDPGSDIVIDEQQVSRMHAMIQNKSGRYLLRDMKSRNGIYVNNLKLENAVLKQGDLFQIGSCVFQFFWS